MITSPFLSPYAFLALVATLGAWISTTMRLRTLRWAGRSLRELPEDSRIRAIEAVYGPVPNNLSADQWVKDRRNRLLLIAFIATVAAATPMVLLALDPSPAESVVRFFGVVVSPAGASVMEPEAQPVAEPAAVDSRQLVHVGSGVNGLISEVFVEVQGQVAAGSAIARVGRPDLDEELTRARSALARAETSRDLALATATHQSALADADVWSADLQIQQAKQHLAAVEQIPNLVLRRILEEAELSLETAKHAMSTAEIRRQLLQATIAQELQRAKEEVDAAADRERLALARIKSLTIVSPVSGTILSIAQPGESASMLPGNPVAVIAVENGRRS
jgi:multidrug efflux pump subunit AcrA (membrane-fusion protein)